jgi:hypothetical protein
MKSGLKQIRRLVGRAAAVLFKVEAIRRYAMRTIAATTFDVQNYSENYPALKAKHLDNARLFANRQDLISSMTFLKGGVIAEIGVADGCFSEFLLSELQPKRFVAFYIFTMHEFTTSWAGTNRHVWQYATTSPNTQINHSTSFT